MPKLMGDSKTTAPIFFNSRAGADIPKIGLVGSELTLVTTAKIREGTIVIVIRGFCFDDDEVLVRIPTMDDDVWVSST